MPFAPGVSTVTTKRNNAKRDRVRSATPWRGWYGLKRWKDIRTAQLNAEPLCAMCSDLGVITQATVCDHVTPHKGDAALFWSGPFQSLCRTHHDRDKQRLETSYQYRPEWLRPSLIPLTIVCGPPASGKTTYVADQSEAGDLVIDLDAIAWRMAGCVGDVHAWDRERWLGPAMRERNNLLGALSKRPPWRSAWLILSEANAGRRQWWADTMHPEEIVVLETQPAECMARVRADDGRDKARTYDAITRWWASYERRDGDLIIKST